MATLGLIEHADTIERWDEPIVPRSPSRELAEADPDADMQSYELDEDEELAEDQEGAEDEELAEDEEFAEDEELAKREGDADMPQQAATSHPNPSTDGATAAGFMQTLKFGRSDAERRSIRKFAASCDLGGFTISWNDRAPSRIGPRLQGLREFDIDGKAGESIVELEAFVTDTVEYLRVGSPALLSWQSDF